jgi:hypothetical protein
MIHVVLCGEKKYHHLVPLHICHKISLVIGYGRLYSIFKWYSLSLSMMTFS